MSRRLNVERMRRHVNSTTPDVFTAHQWDEDYEQRLEAWRARMVAKHGEGLVAHAYLHPGTGIVTVRIVAPA